MNCFPDICFFNEPLYRNLRVWIVAHFASYDQGAAMNGSPKAQFLTKFANIYYIK